MEVKAVVNADSSAALGIAGRTGVGKIRHLDTSLLWVQQKKERGDIEYHKVLGSDNPADLWTKNVDAKLRDKHLAHLNLEYRTGRAGTAATLHEVTKRHGGGMTCLYDFALGGRGAAARE